MQRGEHRRHQRQPQEIDRGGGKIGKEHGQKIGQDHPQYNARQQSRDTRPYQQKEEIREIFRRQLSHGSQPRGGQDLVDLVFPGGKERCARHAPHKQIKCGKGRHEVGDEILPRDDAGLPHLEKTAPPKDDADKVLHHFRGLLKAVAARQDHLAVAAHTDDDVLSLAQKGGGGVDDLVGQNVPQTGGGRRNDVGQRKRIVGIHAILEALRHQNDGADLTAVQFIKGGLFVHAVDVEGHAQIVQMVDGIEHRVEIRFLDLPHQTDLHHAAGIVVLVIRSGKGGIGAHRRQKQHADAQYIGQKMRRPLELQAKIGPETPFHSTTSASASMVISPS